MEAVHGWEYWSIEVMSLLNPTARLNQLGQHGWELATTVVFNGRMYHYLKRPKTFVNR